MLVLQIAVFLVVMKIAQLIQVINILLYRWLGSVSFLSAGKYLICLNFNVVENNSRSTKFLDQETFSINDCCGKYLIKKSRELFHNHGLNTYFMNPNFSWSSLLQHVTKSGGIARLKFICIPLNLARIAI